MVDELSARLAMLFRHYAAAMDLHPEGADRLCAEFREDMRWMIAKYGQATVDKAVAEMRGDVWPSVELH